MQFALDELDRLIGERIRHSQDYSRVLAERDDQLDSLRHAVGPRSERWRSLLEDRSRARTEYEAISGQLGRPVNRYNFPASIFYALAAILAVIETPVNKFLFDTALQSSNAASYLVSFAVAAFILIVAHSAGKLVRQVRSEYTTNFSWSNVILGAVVMIVLAIVVTVLTIGRAEFSAAALDGGLNGLFSSVGAKVASHGLVGALANALADTAALILLMVNVTSIMVAFLLGYFSHDPDKHLDKAFESHKALQRGVERYEARFNKKDASAREQARGKLNAINIRYTAANAAIVAQKTARRLPLEDEDKFSLPTLDPMLARVRGQMSADQTLGEHDAGRPTRSVSLLNPVLQPH